MSGLYNRSTRPWVFNVGVILTGIAALVGAIGLRRALRRLGAHPIVAWLTLLVVTATGLSALWAGFYPLPDPRHGGPPPIMIAMLAMPFVLSFALWRLGVSRAIQAYLIATITLFLVMLPMMIVISPRMPAYQGLLQRISGLPIYVPIGVTAFVLARRIGATPPGIGTPHEVVATALPVDQSH